MASELLPDVLDGLVAAGTLALAAATVYVGRVAIRGALDNTAPRVVVRWLRVDDQPVNRPGTLGADLPTIKPGTSWILKTHGDHKIGLRAVGHLRNEGGTTALLQFRPEADVEVRSVTYQDPSPIPGGPEVAVGLPEQDGWYVIAPGGEATFRLVWWRSASEWAKSHERQPVPVKMVQVAVRGVSGSTRDLCNLTFGGYVLAPKPGEDGWVIAPVNREAAEIPGTVPPRLASVGFMRRSYPGLFRREVRDTA